MHDDIFLDAMYINYFNSKNKNIHYKIQDIHSSINILILQLFRKCYIQIQILH